MICPYCERKYKTYASYRVHKHRKHRGLEFKKPVLQPEVGSESTDKSEDDRSIKEWGIPGF